MTRVVSASREVWRPAAHEHRLVAMRRLRRLSHWSMDPAETPRTVLIGDVVALPGMGLPEKIWRSQVIHSTGLISALQRVERGAWVVGEVVRGRTGAWVLDDVTDDELDAIQQWLTAHAEELEDESDQRPQRRADEVAEVTRAVMQRRRGGAS